jgi:hypothetical protein
LRNARRNLSVRLTIVERRSFFKAHQ